MFPKSFESTSVVLDGSLRDGWSGTPVVTTDEVTVPVHAVGLHYGQIAFEGLRARVMDGRGEAFRPDLHWERLCRSMSRLAMPEIDRSAFDLALGLLLARIPDHGRADEYLYVRPIVVAMDADWGMGGATSFRLHVVAGWTREAFDRVPHVVALVEAQRRRSWPGGTGDVKIPANYGPAFAAQRRARAAGAHTVLWLDPEDRTVEEFSSMNAVVVDDAGRLLAPAPGATVLDGVTRRTIVELARDAGMVVDEGPLRWPDPFAGEEGVRGVLLATGTAAGMAVVHEVTESSAGGEARTWRSSTGGDAFAELRTLVDACLWGDGRPEWWVPADRLTGTAVS
ncbi:MAG: aminotransferase class IV [Acidimicrobiales bacterium]